LWHLQHEPQTIARRPLPIPPGLLREARCGKLANLCGISS
jgi:hypothetical protein